MDMTKINESVAAFEKLLIAQQERAERIKKEKEFVDYSSLDKLIIGVCGGDGIGPVITHEAERVLRFLLADDVANGKIVFNEIDGLKIGRASCRERV